MIKEDDMLLQETKLSDIPMSNKISHGGTKLTIVGRLKQVKTLQFGTAYNKGYYMVVKRGYQNSRKESIKCGTLIMITLAALAFDVD